MLSRLNDELYYIVPYFLYFQISLNQLLNLIFRCPKIRVINLTGSELDQNNDIKLIDIIVKYNHINFKF